MVFVGFYNLSNANQNDSLQLNQVGEGNSLFPVMGYASIEIDGTQLSGFTSTSQIGDIDVSSDFIEFFTYRHDFSRGEVDGTRVSGRVSVGPITITKRIDQTTPLLAQGLIQNSLAEGYFLFLTVDQNSGQTIAAFKVAFQQGRVISLRTFTVVGDSGSQLVEEVSFAYQTLIWEDLQNGVTFEYNWQTDA